MTIELYPHNQETYNKIQEMWKTTNRVAAIQATGTGKSFLILKCLFDLPDKKKIVLAPTEYIFEQLVDNSDEEITNVEFITYAKLTYMTEEEIQLLNPSFIVLDEFHRCGAEQWGRGVESLLNIFPDVKVLGTSATPIRYLDNERDMSDELFDGNVAVNLSLAEAIVKGILPMPKYISALYTFDEEIDNLKNKVTNSNNIEEEKEDLLEQINLMRNKLDRSKGIPKILKKYLTDGNSKFIVFCKNKEHLYEMKEVVVSWFKKTKLNNKIETYTVYTGYENLDDEFQAFKDDKNDSLKLLFSIEILNEGIHVEDITGVILLRPTISPIIYYQQIGRAIDAGSSEQPLIFDFVNNFDNIGAKNFVRDLKDSREKEICERNESEESEDIDIPEFIVHDEILEVKELFNNIEDKIHSWGDWDSWYKKLEQCMKKFNNILENHIDKGLNRWAVKQRYLYGKGLLSKERIDLLNKIGFIWDEYDYRWENMFNYLKKYKEEFNDVDVPSRYINDMGIKLGTWINCQREDYKKGKLSDKKINLMEEVGFKWDIRNKKWREMFSCLIEYKKQFNDTNVPQKYIDKNGVKLGLWVNSQRMNYKNGKISNEKIKQLENIGFEWEIRNEWYFYYILLKKYNLNNGHTNVPLRYIFENYNLGRWVGAQRRFYKNNKLSNEKIKLLEEIGFKWSLK